MKGQIYTVNKEYKKAISLYKYLMSLSRERGKERLAAVYAEMGEYDNAINELTPLVADKGYKTGILERITVLNLMNNNILAAVKTAKEMISVVLDKEYGYQILARVYSISKQHNDAINVLKKAEEINPYNIKTKAMIGREYMAVNKLQEAQEIFKKIQKSNPENAGANFMQANILESMGKKESAADKYKEVLELFPDHVPALNNLAYLYAEGYGPADEAMIMAQRANKLAPRDGRINDTLGWVFYHRGNYEDAQKNFLEAANFLPDDPTIRYHLALAYYKKGMHKKSKEQLDKAIHIGPHSMFPDFDEAKKLLEGMI